MVKALSVIWKRHQIIHIYIYIYTHTYINSSSRRVMPDERTKMDVLY